jgi:hypothetical protein
VGEKREREEEPAAGDAAAAEEDPAAAEAKRLRMEAEATGDEYLIAKSKLAPETLARVDHLVATGVIVERELDARSLLSLSEFPAKATLDILEQFAGPNMDAVRNKSAYLAGVMKRYKRDVMLAGAAPSAFQMPAPVDTAGMGRQELLNLLAPVCREALEVVMGQGVITEKDMDERALGFLANLPGAVGAQAVDELSRANLSGVRNISATASAAATAGLLVQVAAV